MLVFRGLILLTSLLLDGLVISYANLQDRSWPVKVDEAVGLSLHSVFAAWCAFTYWPPPCLATVISQYVLAIFGLTRDEHDAARFQFFWSAIVLITFCVNVLAVHACVTWWRVTYRPPPIQPGIPIVDSQPIDDHL